jgi:tRNA pseudouridine38-40 synthase
MRNISLDIEYDGTDYNGWQIQRRHAVKSRRGKSKTVQETIEKVLCKILQEKVRLIGSGRTDSGVHARAQIANFHTNSKIDPDKLLKGLNGLLPDDIAVRAVKEVPLGFHSRYSAKSKKYRYAILNRRYPCAIERNFCYFHAYPLDVKLMAKAARYLRGRHDFSAFRTCDKKKSASIRTISEISVRKKGDFIYIDVEADGFLYNMVRSIAGTLIDVGRGKLSALEIKKILLSKNRALAGPTAPARGLCLMAVKYK